MNPTPTDDVVFDGMKQFVTSVIPAGVEVTKAQINYVPEPNVSFVEMTELARPRLRTNVSTSQDVKFTGSIAGGVLTVFAIAAGSGPILAGATVFGPGVAANTIIGAQISGTPGGVGTYNVTPSQTISSMTLSAGGRTIEQGTQVTMQLDVHGPNSADIAQTISTLFRDPYAVDFFDALGTGISPLYADDPRQAPFLNENQNYETRWVVTAQMQINPTVRVPEQYADSVEATAISVNATYAP